ncbi:elongation factor G [Elusimicrobiota bacterium]
MKVYDTKNIRNVAICGSSGAGKTQLTESILFAHKVINRLGKVDEGNTVSDYDPIEKERQSSINSTVVFFESDEIKINLIDSPGYNDFLGSATSAIEVAEVVLVVINPHEGLDVVTKKIWKRAKALGRAVIIYVNFMDNANADFREIVEQLKSSLSPNMAPVTAPVGKAESFKGIIKLLDNVAVIDGKETGVPEELKDDASEYSESLMDSVAAADDSLMEKFLEEGSLNEEETRKGLIAGLGTGDIIPVLCGSAAKGIGISALIDFIKTNAPSPVDIESVERPIKPEGKFRALVFKAESQMHVGQINYIKIMEGSIKAGEYIFNIKAKNKLRINQIALKRGNENISVNEAKCGDICALVKVDGIKVNDTLGASSDVPVLPEIQFPVPVVERGVYPKTKGEEEKVANAFSSIIDADPTLKFGFNGETKEMVLTGMGSLHLQIVVKKIKGRYDADVDLVPPIIAYKETIRSRVDSVRGKYKKQTGGKGQYGDCVINMLPMDRGQGFEFDNKIVGGRIPSNYIPSVEKGIKEAMDKGVIAGYPVIDFKVELFDGSYHEVDSSDMAFQIAGSMAFQNAMQNANPYILEPVMKACIKVSNDYTGAVMGDLNSRRGRVQGVEPDEDMQVILALVPKGSLTSYADDLKSITSGEGEYTVEFDHYEEAPMDIQQGLISKYQKEREEGR